MTDTLEHDALNLIRRGLPIVICDGKVPLGGNGWHRKPVTESNIGDLLGQAANPAIGLKLGEYIDIEADSLEEEQLVGKLFDGCDPPLTPTYQSTRGKHRIYRSDKRLQGIGRGIVNFSNGSGAKLGIRIGADGKAAQSVIPPSPGREWLVSWDEVEPAQLPDMVVERILAAAGPPPRQSSSSDKHQSGEVNQQALEAMLRHRPDAGEHDGSNRLLCVCCRAVEQNLTDAAAVATIHEYERRHPFPHKWTDADIERRLRDAERKATRGAALETTARRLTDVGNAERFCEQHGADVRYCHPWGKWLVWDGRRWRIDDSGEVIRRAKLTARSIYVEASKASDKHEREALAKWASASERRERLSAMVALAESEQPIPAAVESWDSEPWLLNCENGTLDLRTGELHPHRREDYLTKLCPVEYPLEGGSDPELWVAFLDRVFASNARLIGFLRRLVGMALVGEILENILAIFYGSGANGKSVFIETVCGMLGNDYAMSATTSLLMVDQHSRHPTEKTDLFGRRFVATVETGDGGRLSEETVKQLTSREAIRARRMREDFWEFKPSHTVVMATNHKPTVRGTDFGIWRRLRLVPFSVVIPENERDKELANKLRSEWPAILRWAVGGCLEWQRDGLSAPDEVLEATEAYRADQDTLGEFLEECCEIGEQLTARASDLYHAYTQWCEARGEYKQTQTKFGTQLSERGFRKGRATDGRKAYFGVGVHS